MIIHDRIYGKITVENPLIIDLINSKPVQRLKKISHDGATHFIQPIRDITRFEHSIGTWYLSARFNRPIVEQAASLLHDVGMLSVPVEILSQTGALDDDQRRRLEAHTHVGADLMGRLVPHAAWLAEAAAPGVTC